MDKYTKVKEINKNGCYYTKKKTQIMTALNLVDKIRKEK